MAALHFCDDPVCPDPVWKLSKKGEVNGGTAILQTDGSQTEILRVELPGDILLSVNKHSFYVSLGHATQQHKLFSSP